jgi:hypothetical protein
MTACRSQYGEAEEKAKWRRYRLGQGVLSFDYTVCHVLDVLAKATTPLSLAVRERAEAALAARTSPSVLVLNDVNI